MANPVKIRIRADTSKLDYYLSGRFLDSMGDVCHDAAVALVDDIRDNWTSHQPSSPGEPPAIKTGNLDSSVQASPQGRDILGRFANRDNTRVWFVTLDTEKGNDPQERGQYAAVLEDDMDRPYMEPAIDRVSEVFPGLVKRVL